MSLGEPQIAKRGAKRIFSFYQQFSMQGGEEGILDPGQTTEVLEQIPAPF